MSERPKQIQEIERKRHLDLYLSLQEIVLADTRLDFVQSYISAAITDIYYVVQELRPNNISGTRFFQRDYNLTEDELYQVWKSYCSVHNFDEDCKVPPISFDPPNWKELAEGIVQATKRFNCLAEQFIQEHGYDIEEI